MIRDTLIPTSFDEPSNPLTYVKTTSCAPIFPGVNVMMCENELIAARINVDTGVMGYPIELNAKYTANDAHRILNESMVSSEGIIPLFRIISHPHHNFFIISKGRGGV